MTPTDGLVIAMVIVGVPVASRLVRMCLRGVLSVVANRALTGANSQWRTRVPRVLAETVPVAELRRRQRINALALVVARGVRVVLIGAGLVVVMHRFDADPVLTLSSLGFLIAALTVGAQHSIHDYVAGLHVLLEDRYGEGDEIRAVTPAGVLIEGRVEAMGSFATRVATDAGVAHVANRLLVEVVNLSQRPHLATVSLPGDLAGGRGSKPRLARVLSAAVREVSGDRHAGVVVESVEVALVGGQPVTAVTARFDRPLDDESRAAVEEAAATTVRNGG